MRRVLRFSLPKNCTSVLPSWMALSSHFPLPKTLHFSKRFAFFALSNGVIDRGSKQQSKRSNFRLHRSSSSRRKNRKKWIKLIPKTIGNRKRDCAWVCAWGINTIWENLQIEKHKSGRRSFPNWQWIYTFPCRKFAQLAMSLHFPLPKIRTFRFSLHTSRLSLHGEVTMVALKFAMISHFPLPKIILYYYGKRGSASYIVREVLSVRERERDTERERETEVTSPLSRDWRWIHTFTCQKFAQ